MLLCFVISYAGVVGADGVVVRVVVVIVVGIVVIVAVDDLVYMLYCC